LGSWSLIKGYWWKLVGKTVMVGLRILLIGLLYFLAILIIALIPIALGSLLHVAVLSIAGIAFGVLAFLCVCFGFLAPLSIIAMFEVYYNFCDIQESAKTVDEALNKKRKRKIIFCMVLGVIVIIAMFAAIVLVNVNQYVSKAKIAEILRSNDSPDSIVQQIKANVKLPEIINSVTTLTDITAESGSIRYHYTISNVNEQINVNTLKNDIIPSVCNTYDTKILLNKGISLEFFYIVEKTQQNFLITIVKADCPANP